MLSKMDPSWLMLAVATVSMLSYMISLGLDALMKGDGFGPIGNAILITGGFFLSIYVGNWRGFIFHSLPEATIVGVGGALGILLVLTLAKAVVNRM